MISVSAFLRVELVGTALLALWVVTRFPNFGPKSIRPAIGFTALALGVMQVATLGMGLMVGLPHGTYVALFGCVLPSFFAAFLAAAWLLRVLAVALGGSGGGTGHRVPAPVRR